MDLAATSALLRLLSDPTRVRLLALLDREELTVAELADILRLAQPRVSTHLAKLKDADLVRDRRAGVSSYYRYNGELHPKERVLLHALKETIDDALLDEDEERLPLVLARRAKAEGWADTVAGDMERHYSPGRTWETLARAMTQLVDAGDVLDIASGDGILAELLAPAARTITCIDASERVVEAARRRLRARPNVKVLLGDMHKLALPDGAFDLVLLMHALTYTTDPGVVLQEAARVLRPGGRLVAATLGQHAHRSVVEPFEHRNLGFTRDELAGYATAAGLESVRAERLSRERRAPHFEVLGLFARKPG